MYGGVWYMYMVCWGGPYEGSKELWLVLGGCVWEGVWLGCGHWSVCVGGYECVWDVDGRGLEVGDMVCGWCWMCVGGRECGMWGVWGCGTHMAGRC